MGMRKQTQNDAPPPSGEGGWITTYADMITLLMCFFVIMYASSEPSQSKWEQMKGGIESDVMNVKNPTPLADLYNELDAKYDNPKKDNPNIAIDFNRHGIVISLGSSSLFESGEAVLKPEGRKIIYIVSKELRRKLKKYDLIIDVEGHTDDVPMNSAMFPSNWELSSSRAASVVKLATERGIKSKVVRAIGHADSFPIKPNRTKDGTPIPENMAANRRVDIIVHY
jgi:chemotaxis protein MotB